MKRFLARAAIVLAVIPAFSAASAVAHAAVSWQAVCNAASPNECVYANGTDGAGAFAKQYQANWAGENTNIFSDSSPCSTHTDLVQDGADGDDNCNGASYWWPFVTHSLDTQYDANRAADLNANGNCLVPAGSGSLYIVQDAGCGTGHIWINHGVSGSGGATEFVNVLYGDDGNPDLLCAPGDNAQLQAGSTTVNGACGNTDSSKLQWHVAGP